MKLFFKLGVVWFELGGITPPLCSIELAVQAGVVGSAAPARRLAA